MYILVKYTEDGRRAGYVNRMDDYRKVATWPTYQAAKSAARALDAASRFKHEVDLHISHDCAGDIWAQHIVA